MALAEKYNYTSDQGSGMLTILATKLDLLHQDMSEVKVTQEKMAEAIGKLAVIEERQTNTSASVNRAFNDIGEVGKKISALDARVHKLEAASVSHDKTNKWVEAAILGIVILVFQFAAKKLGF